MNKQAGFHTLLLIGVFSFAASPALAGALFDDYLNYVRPGVGTGPGKATAVCLRGHPVGQTMTLPINTGEVYRIGVRPLYDTWTTGERVTLTLFESPRRRQTLGQYSIEQATSRIQAIHDTKDQVLWFQLRAPIVNRPTCYFELSVTGGDNTVSFQAFAEDKLPAGQAFPDKGAIRDLAFECHIKPVPDKQANLKAFFTERLDLTRPELAKVKAAADRGDWNRAITETVRHFHNRRDVWSKWDAYILNPDPKADTSVADLLLKDMLQHSETNAPLPWRAQSYWVPIYTTDRAQPTHGYNPSPFTWHFDRVLGRAYFDTKKEAYARKALDLRMQFILDNPIPKLSGIPWYFELWNDRTAAARAPGFGTWAYSYFHKYPGFGEDQKLVFYCFLEDNARWDYQATSGANWGAEAARACYEFGVLFPEWKMSPKYVQWGTHRLAEIVLHDVRGDGTSTEAAIKYHSMVARRLKGMLDDHFEKRIQLDAPLLEKLLTTTEKMYEVMAYTLQPNNVVVMCGDSWNENFATGLRIGREDVKDLKALVTRMREGQDALTVWIRSQFEEPLRKKLAESQKTGPTPELLNELYGELSKKIVNPPRDEKTDARPEPIFTPERFAGVKLSPVTQRLLEVKPLSVELETLNRMLLSDAYPDIFETPWERGELRAAGEMTARPDYTWIASQGQAGTPPKDVSKVLPDGGYFIMRSDFGQAGAPHGAFASKGADAAAPPPFLDARQLFIHNGPWFGAHGHADLLSLNLYAFGRTLIVDPGQYDYNPPPGIGKYWASSMHSMLVVDGKDTARAPGPGEWSSNALADYFDGVHEGYKNVAVRRRVAFIKPDYFVVEDSTAPRGAATTQPAVARDWAQVWHLADPQARIDEKTHAIQTTFPSGGNVLILNQSPAPVTVETAAGIRTAAGSKNHYPTRIIRLHQQSGSPRFLSLLIPYDGATAPKVEWEPSNGTAIVRSPRGADWIGFGEAGKRRQIDAKTALNADFAAILAGGGFCWSDGTELVFDGFVRAKASQRVHSLSVRPSGGKLLIDVSEPEPSLAISVANREGSPGEQMPTLVLNGQEVRTPVIRDGMYYPYANQPVTIIADDRDAFEPVTKTDEWWRTADPRSWQVGYTQHETDPGRHESGRFTLHVRDPGKYTLEVYMPHVSVVPSDRVEYRFTSNATLPAARNAIVSAKKAENESVVIVDQQQASGWITLGQVDVAAGPVTVTLVNATKADQLYLIADAMRLVKK